MCRRMIKRITARAMRGHVTFISTNGIFLFRRLNFLVWRFTILAGDHPGQAVEIFTKR